MTQLSISTRHDLDRNITTIEFAGTLSLRTAPAVRSALLKAGAECPEAVIVDVSACRCDSRSALNVFPAAAAHGHGSRPDAALIVITADPEFWRLRSGLGPIPLHRSWQDAADAVQAGRVGQRRATFRFGRSEFAPRQARAALDELCRNWGINHVRDATLTIVSELVTNAVTHAASDAYVDAVMRGDFLHIRVRDDNVIAPAPAAMRQVGHGNGLPIVEVLSSGWGFVADERGGGKVVWATVRIRPMGTGPVSQAVTVPPTA